MHELEEIRVFVQVVESGSATQAADALDVAVSAISRRLKALEKRLGTQLLQRTTRRMHLTEQGQQFYLRCKQILEDMLEAEQLAGSERHALSGTIRLATPVSFGVFQLMPAINRFAQLHPNIHLVIDTNDRRVDLVAEGLDLAIRVGPLTDSNLMARKLCDFNHVVCASPAFWIRHGKPQHPTELTKLPALCYGNLPQPKHWQYSTQGGETHSVSVNPVMTISNGDALTQAAINDMGVICEPAFIVADAIEKGELETVLGYVQWYGMPIHAVYPQTRFVSARVRTLIDFLVEYFAIMQSWQA